MSKLTLSPTQCFLLSSHRTFLKDNFNQPQKWHIILGIQGHQNKVLCNRKHTFGVYVLTQNGFSLLSFTLYP